MLDLQLFSLFCGSLFDVAAILSGGGISSVRVSADVCVIVSSRRLDQSFLALIADRSTADRER